MAETLAKVVARGDIAFSVWICSFYRNSFARSIVISCAFYRNFASVIGVDLPFPS